MWEILAEVAVDIAEAELLKHVGVPAAKLAYKGYRNHYYNPVAASVQPVADEVERRLHKLLGLKFPKSPDKKKPSSQQITSVNEKL